VHGDLILVGADDSEMYALNAGDGKQVWDQLCAGVIGGDPLILNDTLVFAAQDMVYATDPTTGAPKWICAMAAPVSEGPVTDGTMLYFLGQDGSLQSVDGVEGRFRWAVRLPTGPGAFPPIVAGQRIIVASGKTLVSVSRSGAVSWTAELPLAIGGRPTLVGEQLYVPTVAGELPGAERQAIQRISPTQVLTGAGQILVLYPRSGRQQRSALYAVAGTASSPPLLEGSTLFEGTANALIYALDQETGAVDWIYRCISADQPLDEASNYGIYAPLAVGGDALYCLTGSGDLYGFSASAPDSAGPVFSNMQPESSDALPGARPVDVTFSVTDQASGVDPASIQATYDGAPTETEFDPMSGEVRFHVRSPKDGVHIVKATAKDYRGNANTDHWSFLTDSSIKPPPSTQPGRSGTTRGGARGGQGGARGGQGGARGGMGGGGGMRGGGGGMRGGGRRG
jgi:outer membrane protein assembly factor BamB